MSFKQIIKRTLPRSLYPLARLFALYGSAVKNYIQEAFSRNNDEIPLPPLLLRHRVHGRLDRKSFLGVGKTCAENIESTLSAIGRPFASLKEVLDFGCGCGRVLRHFTAHTSTSKFYGCDIDPETIAWCKEKMPFGQFEVNNPMPETPYSSDKFDMTYAISIFTHLDESFQFAWLKELKRISKVGGILLLTVHGDYAHSKLTKEEKAKVDHDGFLFKVEATGKLKADGLPDFYQNAYHTKAYVMKEWSKFFVIKKYIERGVNNHQDLVVLEKKT